MVSSCSQTERDIGACARLGWLGWCLVVAGCSSPAVDAGRAAGACHFGPEHSVASAVHARFDGLQLVPVGDGALGLWSDPSGLYARALGPEGTPLAPPVRLAGQCDGGMAAVGGAAATGGGHPRTVVACLRAARREAPAGGVVLYGVHTANAAAADDQGAAGTAGTAGTLGVRVLAQLGPAGRLSQGVAAVWDAGVLHVAWLDADAEAHRVRLSAWRPAGGATASRVRSVAGHAAGSPDLLASPTGGPPIVAFAEAYMGEGLPVSEVVVAPIDGRVEPTRIGVAEGAPAPRLGIAAGRVHVAYRDRRRRGERTGLYVQALDGRLRPAGAPLRVARADGDATPAVAACLHGLVASTPRTFAGDYFLGVNWIRPGPERGAPEQQFYEDAHEFTHTAVTCVGGRALLLIGERGRPGQAATSLRAATFSCR